MDYLKDIKRITSTSGDEVCLNLANLIERGRAKTSDPKWRYCFFRLMRMMLVSESVVTLFVRGAVGSLIPTDWGAGAADMLYMGSKFDPTDPDRNPADASAIILLVADIAGILCAPPSPPPATPPVRTYTLVPVGDEFAPFIAALASAGVLQQQHVRVILWLWRDLELQSERSLWYARSTPNARVEVRWFDDCLEDICALGEPISEKTFVPHEKRTIVCQFPAEGNRLEQIADVEQFAASLDVPLQTVATKTAVLIALDQTPDAEDFLALMQTSKNALPTFTVLTVSDVQRMAQKSVPPVGAAALPKLRPVPAPAANDKEEDGWSLTKSDEKAARKQQGKKELDDAVAALKSATKGKEFCNDGPLCGLGLQCMFQHGEEDIAIFCEPGMDGRGYKITKIIDCYIRDHFTNKELAEKCTFLHPHWGENATCVNCYSYDGSHRSRECPHYDNPLPLTQRTITDLFKKKRIIPHAKKGPKAK
jgi:hypothetical protein